MTGRVTHSGRTTRSAGSRSSTAGRRCRRRTSGGRTHDQVSRPCPALRSSVAGAPYDARAGRGLMTTEGRVYTVSGQDWDEVVAAADEMGDRPGAERLIGNMGPQHPSTHGVLRLILTLDGETVTELRPVIGYLHTGIEKNMEFRTWTQGVTFCTRMDYLSPLFNETAYCLATERLLGITDQVPERATVLRVLMMELNRIASHLTAVGTFGLEVGATTVFLYGMREREKVLDLLELITGLRMNHAYIRPGGVSQDLPSGALEKLREFLGVMPGLVGEIRALFDVNPVYLRRTRDIAFLDLAGCMALGVTGPILRATGLPWDLRKSQPYCGYETYDFDVPTEDSGDVYGRYLGRMDEAAESPRGELGCHAVSDGGTRPYRVRFRDPSFTNLQSVSVMCEGGMVADVIAAVASIDPVMGGVDR